MPEFENSLPRCACVSRSCQISFVRPPHVWKRATSSHLPLFSGIATKMQSTVRFVFIHRVHGNPTCVALHLTLRAWQGTHALVFLVVPWSRVTCAAVKLRRRTMIVSADNLAIPVSSSSSAELKGKDSTYLNIPALVEAKASPHV
jgi:hypothetical protein